MILCRCRTEVMAAKTPDEVLDIISSMKEERQDAVLTQALDLWELDGCPLVAGGGAEQENNVTSQTSCDKTSLESRLSMEINVD